MSKNVSSRCFKEERNRRLDLEKQKELARRLEESAVNRLVKIGRSREREMRSKQSFELS